MPRLDYKSLAIAFVAELGADILIQAFLMTIFTANLLSGSETPEQRDQVLQEAMNTTALCPTIFIFGMLTTVAGGYLAARLARRIPYYHGLAMGVVGLVYAMLMWNANARWYDYIGVLLTIPASIYGAHIARRHIPSET